jgi:hypothetical protein
MAAPTLVDSADMLPDIWRLALRSGRGDMEHRHTEQVEHCRSRGLAALGWGVRRKGSRDVVLQQIQEEYPGTPRHTVQRFMDAQDGSLIWTLHTDGTYCIGKFVGPWYYDDTSAAADLDCYQVRPVEWAPTKLDVSQVPGAVIRAFSGRGSSFSRIHDPGARRYSHFRFEVLMGRTTRVPSSTPEEVLQSLLHPWDVEDLVALYLQVVRKFLILPASRQTGTAGYEYVLIDLNSRRQVIVQVKTGDSSVDLVRLASAAGSERLAIAFSTRGLYKGQDSRVEKLTNQEILKFMEDYRSILPDKIRGWLDY